MNAKTQACRFESQIYFILNYAGKKELIRGRSINFVIAAEIRPTY